MDVKWAWTRISWNSWGRAGLHYDQLEPAFISYHLQGCSFSDAVMCARSRHMWLRSCMCSWTRTGRSWRGKSKGIWGAAGTAATSRQQSEWVRSVMTLWATAKQDLPLDLWEKHGYSPSFLSSQAYVVFSGSQPWPRDTAGAGLLRNTNSSLAKLTQYKTTTFSCRHDQFSCKKIIWKYVKEMIPWTFTHLFFPIHCMIMSQSTRQTVVYSNISQERKIKMHFFFFTIYAIFYILCKASQNDKTHWLRFQTIENSIWNIL